ncbi:MAG: hypothetical protein JO208_10215 [Alphaproteobacteria bacterium]|nr:hypothetical protein [Alphaproteobacteria bacterium]
MDISRQQARSTNPSLSRHRAVDEHPNVFPKAFQTRFAGFTFAAIAIDAFVPAAATSFGAANTFTRNFWRPFANRPKPVRVFAWITRAVELERTIVSAEARLY